MPPSLLLFLLLLPSSQKAPAGQGGKARQRVSGRAILADGSPWAGARIHLFSRPCPGFLDLGRPDHVQVGANEQGRFRARILPGRPYSVWAQGPNAGGEETTSLVLEDVTGGSPLRLREDPDPRWPGRLALLLRREDRGPYEVLLVTEMRNLFTVRLKLDASLQADFPVLPGAQVWAEVYDGKGRPLLLEKLHPGSGRGPGSHRNPLDILKHLLRTIARNARRKAAEGATAGGKPPPGRASRRILLREPGRVEVTFHLRAKKGGQPIQGARVRHRVFAYDPTPREPTPFPSWALKREAWRLLGETDARGILRAEVPGDPQSWGRYGFYQVMASFLVEKEGLATSWTAEARSLGQEAPKDAEGKPLPGEHVVASLEPEVRVQGRVLAGGGRPFAHRELLVQIPYFNPGRNHWVYGDPFSQKKLRTDGEGRFEIRGLAEGQGFHAFALPGPGVLRELPALRAGGGAPPSPFLFLGQGKAARDSEPVLDLGALSKLDLALRGPSGSPVRGGELCLFLPKSGIDPRRFPFARLGGQQTLDLTRLRLVTDRRGRCSLLLPEGRYAFSVLLGEEGFALGSLRVGRALLQEEEIRLEAVKRLQGRVVDGSGRGIPGAVIRCSRWRTMGGLGPAERRVQAWNTKHLTGRTDEKGAFDLPFIPLPGLVYRVRASVSRAGRPHASDDLYEVTAARTDLEIQIDLPGAGKKKKEP